MHERTCTSMRGRLVDTCSRPILSCAYAHVRTRSSLKPHPSCPLLLRHGLNVYLALVGGFVSVMRPWRALGFVFSTLLVLWQLSAWQSDSAGSAGYLPDWVPMARSGQVENHSFVLSDQVVLACPTIPPGLQGVCGGASASRCRHRWWGRWIRTLSGSCPSYLVESCQRSLITFIG